VQGGPLMHVIAGKAVCFGEALKPEFKAYSQQVVNNARVLAESLAGGGLSLVSGGTDNHLILINVLPLDVGGTMAENALHASGITVNKNMIPYDERRPDDPSGIRIGTPALTSRGMGEDEMRTIARWMLEALRAPEDTAVHQRICGEVLDLCTSFPVPAALLDESESVAVR
jgi:glycine hydroxymethyltransferase